jgi:hypothetical protein
VISTNSNIEYDLTGYGNNGVIGSGVGQTSNSVRYNTATTFTSTTGGITQIPCPLSNSSKEFTISCWIYLNDRTTNKAIYNDRTVVGEGISVFLLNNPNQLRLDDGTLQTTFTYTFPVQTWTHVTVTRSSTEKKLYINGALQQTVGSVGTLRNVGLKGSVGVSSASDAGTSTSVNYFNGNMSDFRVYATALSADDIKELYNLPMSIDNNSNLLSREINELDKSGVTKNYGAKTQEFIENSGKSILTVTGALTNNNGVYSGFSSSNYITTNGSISADTSNFIVYGHYRTGSDINTEQYVGCTSARNLSTSIMSSKFRLLVCSNNGGGWGTTVLSNNTVTTNTDYYYKIVSRDSKLYLYVNGEVWITLALPASGTYASATWGFGNHLPTKVCPSLGSVNLKQCGIVIDGVTTWCGADAVLGSVKAKIGADYISANQMEEF